MTKLDKKLKDLPKSPGVYYFIGRDGNVLYVGKAKNLNNRIKSYFLKELNRGPAIPQMIGEAGDIHWIETDSEIEAVILEAEQIRKLKPKYNVRLKDDKSFLAIKIAKKISNSEFLTRLPDGQVSNKIPNSKFQNSSQKIDKEHAEYPIVELVRYKDIDPGDKSADYFGPYPSGDALRKSLRYLRKIFPFRDCSITKWRTAARKDRPCIYYDIKVCPAPCISNINLENYRKNLNYLKRFLRGQKKEIIVSLEREMKGLAKQNMYEEAAVVRDKLRALYHLKDVALGIRDDYFSGELGLFERIECYDISNIGQKYAVGSMIVMTKGKPDKAEYRKFKIKIRSHSEPIEVAVSEESQDPSAMPQDDNTGDLARLEQVLLRRFKRTDWAMPDLIVIDGGELHLKVALQVLNKYNLIIPAVSISKGPRREKNDFHFANQAIASIFYKNEQIQNVAIAARDESHRFAIDYYRKLHRKDLFQ